MTGIRRAQDRLEDAKRLVAEARLDLGRAIAAARADGVQQKDIGALLGLTREQVRRLEAAAKEAAEPYSFADVPPPTIAWHGAHGDRSVS